MKGNFSFMLIFLLACSSIVAASCGNSGNKLSGSADTITVGNGDSPTHKAPPTIDTTHLVDKTRDTVER